MKNKFLNKIGYVFLSIFVFIVSLTSCVKDGWLPCENKLRFVYEYNMDRMDKFCNQVKYLSIFAFDSETGLLEEEIVVNISAESNFTMDVPQSFYGKKYDLYVWAGLNPDSYNFPQMTRNISYKEDLKVQARGYEQKLIEKQMEPLWHGELLGIQFDSVTEKTETVYMIKDTNTFRLIFTYMDNLAPQAGMPYTLDELEVCIKSPNGWIAYDNSILDDQNRLLDHVPYISETDDTDLIYEMNSLRLMEDRSATLTVRHKATGKLLYTMDLNRYLKLLMLDEYKWINSLQEYLDREDSYRIIIAVNGNGSINPGEETWTSVTITINNWVVREHDIN